MILGAIFRRNTTLRKYLSQVKPPTDYMSIPCSCGKVYKDETCRPLKVRKYQKAICRGVVDCIGKEKGNHLPSSDEVKIIGKNIGK